ncbi:Rossmann-fold NAD(P)-binding domain-containing protein [Actinoalloteichus hymeniacidonis]|uniref:NAD(P)-binding domain-containing protein n=1 Tax=Actinoalloteichus hymeniacidonis TaxID=340345 RepID=A0AAC9HU06_9PSEU|nr:hypothetical protein [Actinoalloteichus hymeniacidonis]AOS64475.1 hypothetical protein TL08_18400 [Actinoalloteichus hymeniacidonis]MBB5907455.1 NAD(P)H dehydrogenase (quinone) [Actinoalloteichus hymeniacidonis]
MIVVVGADQPLGRAAVDQLTANGQAHRRLDLGTPAAPDGAEAQAAADSAAARIERTVVDEAIFDGADGVLIAPAPGGTGAEDGGAGLLTGLIDQAGAAGVGRVVYFSIVAAQLSPIAFHARIEEHLRNSRIDHTVLRVALSLEAFQPLIRHAAQTGELPAPAGAARFAAAPRADYAAAGLAALTPGIAGPQGELTAASAFDLTELAAAVAAATGKPVRRTDSDDETVLAALAAQGVPTPSAGALLSLIKLGERGAFEAVSPHLRVLLAGPGTELTAAVRAVLAG